MIDAIHRFLAVASADGPPDYLALTRVLDELLAAYHAVPEGAQAKSDAEPPEEDWKVTYQAVAKRFKAFGLYPWADLTDLSAGPLVGDAVDDLADLISEMRRVAWRWEHLGESDARFYLRQMYFHWGEHLIELRAFMRAHDLDRPA
jgi:hypothetical protein